MKTIDFLPPEMLRRNEVRSLRWWWVGVCIAFGLFIGTAATLQFLRRNAVKSQIAQLQPLCDIAKAHEKLIAELNVQLRQESQVANLFAFLDHPWPRSRILADVILPLPADVHITELKLGPQQLIQPRSKAAAETQVFLAPQEQTQEPAAIEDFKKLWERSSGLRTVVEIKGITRDTIELYEYVGDLADRTLVESAKLEALEEVVQQNNRRMQFTVRIIIRPAYSLPGGPGPSPDAPPQSVAATGVVR